MAVIAEWINFIVILVVGIIKVDDTPAVFAAGLVPVIAGLTERRIFVSGIVIPVDTLSTVGADNGLLVGAGFAECVFVHLNAFTQQM